MTKRKRIPWFMRAKFTCPECELPMDHDNPSHVETVEYDAPNTLGLHEMLSVNLYDCPRCHRTFTEDEGLDHMQEKYYPQPTALEGE